HCQLRVVGGMGEKPQRQSTGFQQRNSILILQERRQVSGIAVGKKSLILVVTTQERRSMAYTSRRFHDGAVNREQHLSDGVQLVQITSVEKLRTIIAQEP